MSEQQLTLPPSEPPAGAEASWKQDVWSARADGRIDGFAWPRYEAAYNRVGESLASAPPQTPQLSQQQAATKLEALRAQRIAGTISDRDFMSQMDVLGPLAAGELPGAAQPMLTIDQQLQQQIDLQMAPAQPHEYEFQYPIGHTPTDDDIAWDSEVRSAFSTMGVPKHLGGPIFEAVDQVMTQLGDASEEIRGARISEVTGELQKQWGHDFVARISAIDSLIYEATEKHSKVAEAVYGMPWLLADIRVMQWLDSVAQHRAGKHS